MLKVGVVGAGYWGPNIIRTRDQIYNTLIQYRTGDMHCLKVPQTEALTLEIDHFVDCITSGKKPVTDGRMGHRVVQILEASEASIKNRGKEIRLA